MADLAFINGWGPETMDPMPLDDLIHFRELAMTRWNAVHAGKDA